jgi:hypothetical protein
MKLSPERRAIVREAQRRYYHAKKLKPNRMCECGRPATLYIGGTFGCETCRDIDNRNHSWLRKEWEAEQPSEDRARRAETVNRKYWEGITS